MNNENILLSLHRKNGYFESATGPYVRIYD